MRLDPVIPLKNSGNSGADIFFKNSRESCIIAPWMSSSSYGFRKIDQMFEPFEINF
jgi:hypothetical protein